MQTIKFLAILVAAASEMAAENAPSRRLIVNLPARKIALVQDGRVVKMYSVAVGKKSTPSPSGAFHVASHVMNPTYSHEGKVVGPGPSNPVGTRWMSLGFKGYGIHGTNHPESIGHAASHGCIRLRNHDVEELFELVRVGDEVDLIADPTPEEASLFEETPADNLQAKAVAADGRAVGGLQ
ncbi:MAG TPA: L,D-transpeptidase [Bryobacteraceae bacterium]|jgi:lipoprotein-anchoring transpeptidase ErfK/SrfK|nr:L,D-transpeptidase [Bryobacteraceae bacterium]